MVLRRTLPGVSHLCARRNHHRAPLSCHLVNVDLALAMVAAAAMAAAADLRLWQELPQTAQRRRASCEEALSRVLTPGPAHYPPGFPLVESPHRHVHRRESATGDRNVRRYSSCPRFRGAVWEHQRCQTRLRTVGTAARGQQHSRSTTVERVKVKVKVAALLRRWRVGTRSS